MERFDIVCLGEILIDMFPGKVGQRIREVETFYPRPGGAPANVAVAASRLGARSAFIGKVGQDHFGEYLADLLAEEGVDTSGLRFDHAARTTLAIIALRDVHTAEYVFYRNPGADQLLRPDELDPEILGSAGIFHFGTLSLTDEPARSATREAIRIAREGGALISCDVNYRPALWKDEAQALAEIRGALPGVDLVKINEEEAALLAEIKRGPSHDHPTDLEAAAEAVLALGPRLVVITLGADGSYFKTSRGESALVEAFKVKSVDPVGCGDAFTAGLLTKIGSARKDLRSLDADFLQGAVRFANAVGAITSMGKGAIPALPGLEDVRSFLDRYEDR